MLSKTKEYLNKISNKVKQIFGSIKNYDIKNIKNDMLETKNRIKSSIFNIVGCDKLVNMVGDVKASHVNYISLGIISVIAFCAVAGSNLDFGYSVLSNGKTIALTSKKAVAYSAYENAKKELEGIAGAKVENAKIAFVIANREMFQNEELATNAVIAAFDGKKESFGIYADGELVVALNSEEEANSLLNEYQNEYKGEGVTGICFNKNVEVKSARVPASFVMNKEEAMAVIKLPSGGIKIHTVKDGETMSEIAEDYKISCNKLMELNPGVTPETLQIGAKLNISDSTPVIAVRTKENITQNEKIAYGVNKVNDSSKYKGTTVIVSQGVEGEKEVSYDVYKENGIVVSKVAISENIIKEPVSQQVKVGTKARPVYATTGTFMNPFAGGMVTSRYGSRSRGFHTGLDLAGRTGSSVKAADGGTVYFTGWSGGYGKMIKIRHSNGYETYYAHLSAINVSNGQKVAKGEHIGKVGNTGNSTGPHLHFEIRLNGKTLNPQKYIR